MLKLVGTKANESQRRVIKSSGLPPCTCSFLCHLALSPSDVCCSQRRIDLKSTTCPRFSTSTNIPAFQTTDFYFKTTSTRDKNLIKTFKYIHMINLAGVVFDLIKFNSIKKLEI